MNTTATLPLVLELSQPTQLDTDPQTLFRDGLLLESTKYNPETQLREDTEGRAHFLMGGGKFTNSQCWNFGVLNIDDVINDVVVL
jgi:hypothetical protein